MPTVEEISSRGELKEKVELGKRMVDAVANRFELIHTLLDAGVRPSEAVGFGHTLQAKIILDTNDYFKHTVTELFKLYPPKKEVLAANQKRKMTFVEKEKMRKAVETGDVKKLQKLVKAGVDVTKGGADASKGGGEIPWIFCPVIMGHTGVFDFLIDAGTDIHQTCFINGSKSNVLMMLLDNFDEIMFCHILDAGFNPNTTSTLSIEEADFKTDITWHWYALVGNLRAIELLLEKKLQLDMVTKSGVNIIDLLNPEMSEEQLNFHKKNEKPLEKIKKLSLDSLANMGVDIGVLERILLNFEGIVKFQKEYLESQRSHSEPDEEVDLFEDPYLSFHPDLRGFAKELVEEGYEIQSIVQTLDYLLMLIRTEDKRVKIAFRQIKRLVNSSNNLNALLELSRGGNESHRKIYETLKALNS
ncbi:MAG: hypothetical protein AAGG81_05835 [Chlamydiota bacterium]